MAHGRTTSRRNWILTLPIIAICCAAIGQETPPKPQTVMEAKLTHASNLIKALVAEDFQALDKEAREMAAVTREAAWSKEDAPVYQAESFEFEVTLQLLRELAREKNTKGAALACITLTLNCVDCHQAMRGGGDVKLGDVKVPAVEDLPIDEADKASAWMQVKLARTQQALAGLVSEDYDSLDVAATSMLSLSKFEAWARRGTIPRYDMHVASFDYACEQLAASAKEENIESAALAYTQLLLSCVNCHSDLRKSDENIEGASRRSK